MLFLSVLPFSIQTLSSYSCHFPSYSCYFPDSALSFSSYFALSFSPLCLAAFRAFFWPYFLTHYFSTVPLSFPAIYLHLYITPFSSVTLSHYSHTRTSHSPWPTSFIRLLFTPLTQTPVIPRLTETEVFQLANIFSLISFRFPFFSWLLCFAFRLLLSPSPFPYRHFSLLLFILSFLSLLFLLS